MKGYILNKIQLAALILGSILVVNCTKDPIPEFRIVYFPNKKNIKEEWSIVRTPRGDTLEQGVHKLFYWDGAAAQSEVWKQGKREGSSQAWYENGGTKWLKHYVAGRPDGLWRLNRQDGQPWEVRNYANGFLNGPLQVWDNSSPSVLKEAIFTKGNCTSGDCGLLDFPIPPSDTGVVATEMARDRAIIEAFRN